MPTASINLPLYRALRSLDVSEDAAVSAAEVPVAPSVDLSHLATKDDLARFATKDDLARFATRDELRAEIASVRTEIVQAAQRQTVWLIGVVLASSGLVVALLRAFPAK